MSFHLVSAVLRQSEEKLGRRLVLIVLADYANADGTGAWPSVDTIAQEARLSRRQVQSCLRGLEGDGVIEKAGKSPYGTTIYNVLSPSTGGADSAPSPGGADSAPQPDEGCGLQREGVRFTASDVSQTSPDSALDTVPTLPGKSAADSPPPPGLVMVDGRNLGLDALCKVCGIDASKGGPRVGRAASALFGPKNRKTPGIRDLYWRECLAAVKERPDLQPLFDQLAQGGPEFERGLAHRIEQKGAAFRRPGQSFMDPGTLRDYWMDVDVTGGSAPAHGSAADRIDRMMGQ